MAITTVNFFGEFVYVPTFPFIITFLALIVDCKSYRQLRALAGDKQYISRVVFVFKINLGIVCIAYYAYYFKRERKMPTEPNLGIFSLVCDMHVEFLYVCIWNQSFVIAGYNFFFIILNALK